MVSVIFLDRCYNSISAVVEDLKRSMGSKIRVITCDKNKAYACQAKVVDYVEEKDYEERMIDICSEYEVDLLITAKTVSEQCMKKLDGMGVRVISDCSIRTKSGYYEDMIRAGLDEFIPYYLKVSSENDESLEKAYSILDNINNPSEAKLDNYCVKLDKSEGGVSFRKIVKANNELTSESLNSYRVNEISTYEMKSIIDKLDKDNLIIMRYIPGSEISVDCYNSSKGFIAVCREKGADKRQERVFFDKDIIDACKRIYEEIGLSSCFNVQFKSVNGILKIIDINERISGGLFYSTAIGLNILEVMIKDKLNMLEDIDVIKFNNFEETKVYYIEYPIKL